VEQTTVAIIGAGPAGLAVGACLRKAGVDFIILEKQNQVGSSWRKHYERLHLHTIKRFSSLPFRGLDKNYPRYVPREQMVRYLEGYAICFDLKPRFDETVLSVRRKETEWAIESTTLSLRAPHVVIASGLNTFPITPSFPGLDKFKGRVIHSADYVNAKPFTGQNVLVIGMGNTGAEIALDLSESGARPTISIRGGVHIVPRDLFGMPIQLIAMLATSVLPLKINDALFPTILDLALGNLSRHGIKRPERGILEQVVKLGKIPVLDIGTVKKISEGKIKVMPGISAITADAVIFEGGPERQFDAIIFATGYRPSYQSFLEAQDINLNGDMPSNNSAGIYFVGFHSPVTGLLREISKEAVQVAADIVRQRNQSTPQLLRVA
jgi:cation diffusion facilitator CzcD-associated flavoprotein CzcO